MRGRGGQGHRPTVPSCCAALSSQSSRSLCRLSPLARPPSFWSSIITRFPPCEQSLAAAGCSGSPGSSSSSSASLLSPCLFCPCHRHPSSSPPSSWSSSLSSPRTCPCFIVVPVPVVVALSWSWLSCHPLSSSYPPGSSSAVLVST